MISFIRKSPVALVVCSVITLSACSSSSKSEDVLNDAQNPTATEDTTIIGSETPTGSSSDPVPGPDNQPEATAALPLDSVRDQLIIDLAAYPIENLSEEVKLLGDTIAISAAPGTRLADGSFSVIVREEEVVTVTQVTQYDCPLGGTMTTDIGRQVINESSYSNFADHDSYQFDQCRIATDGEQLLDGNVRTLTNSVSASRGGFDNRDVQWANFSWQQANGNSYNGSALVDINRLLSFDNQESRMVTVDSFEYSVNGQLEKRIADSTMTLLNSTAGSGAVQNFQLDTNGTVTTAAGVAVQITTGTTLSASQTAPGSPAVPEPFAGVISMAADDGGRLVMTAQPTVGFDPKLVSIVYTTQDGNTTNLEDQAFPELTILTQ